MALVSLYFTSFSALIILFSFFFYQIFILNHLYLSFFFSLTSTLPSRLSFIPKLWRFPVHSTSQAFLRYFFFAFYQFFNLSHLYLPFPYLNFTSSTCSSNLPSPPSLKLRGSTIFHKPFFVIYFLFVLFVVPISHSQSPLPAFLSHPKTTFSSFL